MRSTDQTNAEPQRPTEPIGDPDDTTDFSDEHADTVVDPDEPDSGETESPGRFSGGLDREGPP
jgi:hypothetical protein